MIEISLTQFVDFVSKAGTPKLTVVKNVKKQHEDGYDVQTDFYKSIREGIVDLHRNDHSKSHLDAVTKEITDKKKQTAYPPIVKGYKKFLGKKDISWFDPPRSKWTHGELAVVVNPELGLEIKGERHVVKLYFKKEKLAKLRMDTITHLMCDALSSGGKPVAYAILDVRNAKLIPAGKTEPGLTALLQGEASSFAEIYSQV